MKKRKIIINYGIACENNIVNIILQYIPGMEISMNKSELIFILKNIKAIIALNFSFGQEGEDILLDHMMLGKKEGFYVDIGAHHPIRFSNTMKFYNKGWHGINIDAMPGSMEAFKKIRKRDINLEIGIGLEKGNLEYYDFEEKALNTFDKKLKEERILQGYKLKNVLNVPVMPLKEVLEQYIGEKKEIDFLDIDVEGKDLEVLKSNDWEKFRPKYIVVEVLKNQMNEIYEDAIVKYLYEQGYSIISKMINSVLFEDIRKKDNDMA